MELNELVAMQPALPSIPKVVALLLAELKQRQPRLMRVSQLISTDPALTTRLLKLSNAEGLGLAGHISSVSESLALLGLEHVHTVAAEAAGAASIKALPGIDSQQFWSYSLNVAKLSRTLARMLRLNSQAAFTVGMVHAVGELVLHGVMRDEVVRLNRKISPFDRKRAKLERQYFGFCYAQVGAALARHWQWPPMLVDALQHQYAPFENDDYEPLAGIVHLASWRARAQEASLSHRALAVTFPGVVGEVLGLDIDMVLQQDPFDWNHHGLGRAR